MPEVLRSGDHGRIARWRRDRALLRTARRRPDLLAALPPRALDKRDVAALEGAGFPVPGPMWQSSEVAACGRRVRRSLDRRLVRVNGRSESPTRTPKSRCALSLRGCSDEHAGRAGRPVAADRRPGLPRRRHVKVHARVVEGNRSRVQIFQGVVIRRQGGGLRETFTVRKVSFGVGVERTYPINSPQLDRIEIVTRGDVRRAKLYYLRELRGKKAKIKEKREKAPTA